MVNDVCELCLVRLEGHNRACICNDCRDRLISIGKSVGHTESSVKSNIRRFIDAQKQYGWDDLVNHVQHTTRGRKREHEPKEKAPIVKDDHVAGDPLSKAEFLFKAWRKLEVDSVMEKAGIDKEAEKQKASIDKKTQGAKERYFSFVRANNSKMDAYIEIAESIKEARAIEEQREKDKIEAEEAQKRRDETRRTLMENP